MSDSYYSKVKCRRSIHNLNMSNQTDSEISENSESEEELQQSFEFEELPEIRKRKCNSEHENRKQLSNIKKTPIKQQDIKDSQSASLESFPIKGLFLILAVLFTSLFAIQLTSMREKTVSIDGLKQIFPNEPDDTFDNFETIIDEIVFERAVHPAVFLFLYTKNEQKVNKLVEHLALYASQQLESNEKYIDVHRNEFHSKNAKDDYGFLIDKYKADIIKKKVMLVKNLHDIPGETAQIFHSFCDEISPLVEKVVYIFTLKVESLDGKEEKIAETNLKHVWRDLDNDILMPLITRVTSTVLKILN